MKTRFESGLHTFAIATAGATFLLIVAGALVTSHDAGLSVPDWPLSYGRLMPPMRGGVFYEHGHRMIAAAVGFMTILLNLWLWRVGERRWVRRLALVALALVIIQGTLGGLTVLFFLPPPISVLHATLAQTFFCLALILAVVTSRAWKDLPWPGGRLFASPELRWSALAALAVWVQLILGATLRHSGMEGGSKGVRIVSWALAAHLGGALLVIASVVFTSIFVVHRRPSPRLFRLVLLQVALLFVQLLLGAGALVARLDTANRIQPTTLRIWISTAHVGVGALLLGASVGLVLAVAFGLLGGPSPALTESQWAGQTS